MAVDERLVTKGKGEPRDGLAQQGKVHGGLGQLYAAELAEAGWSAEDTAALLANVAALETAVGEQGAAYDEAGSATSAEADAIGDAKAFIRRLRNALPRVLREAQGAGVTFEAFNAGEKLGRSTPRVSKYLATIRPRVVALDEVLKPHFKGKAASGELDGVKDRLDAADTAQELARKHAPGETLALYEKMGKVLEQIEDMNRAGKSAFDGDAVARAKFNKDLRLRARATAKVAAAPQ